MREERKKDTEKEKTKVPSDANKPLGQDEEPLKQGLGTICLSAWEMQWPVLITALNLYPRPSIHPLIPVSICL